MLTEAQIEIAKAMTESQLQDNILAMAFKLGWLCYHTRAAMNKRGQWSSPLQGTPGFPDLILARAGVVICRELKSQKGKLTGTQQAWLEAMHPGCKLEALVWRPHDWLSGEVEALLR